MKQVILVRRDLNMRRGKEVAQGAHASLMAVLGNIHDSRVAEWFKEGMAKIALTVDSEAELLELCNEAKRSGLICSIITDAGRTEFHGTPTKTAAAIGPDRAQNIDPITHHLKLR